MIVLRRGDGVGGWPRRAAAFARVLILTSLRPRSRYLAPQARRRLCIVAWVLILARSGPHVPSEIGRTPTNPSKSKKKRKNRENYRFDDAPCQRHSFLDLCVSSLRRGHANLLCIVPIFTDDSEEFRNLRGNPDELARAGDVRPRYGLFEYWLKTKHHKTISRLIVFREHSFLVSRQKVA